MRTIEMANVSEIFYGFCKSFSSLGITVAPTPSTWKYRVYYFFDMLGRMSGYEVFTEDTFTKSNGIKNLVGKRIDMTWVAPESDGYALALEYENTKNVDDEIDKLVAMTGLRILVMFRFNYTDKDIIEKIRPKLKEFHVKGSNFLVLILPIYFKLKKPFEKLRALLFDSKGRIVGFGTAEGYVGKDGVCSFKNTSWKKIKRVKE